MRFARAGWILALVVTSGPGAVAQEVSESPAFHSSTGQVRCTWCARIEGLDDLAASARAKSQALRKHQRVVAPRARTSLGEVEASLPDGEFARFALTREEHFGLGIIRGKDAAGRRLLMVMGKQGAMGAIDRGLEQWDIRSDATGTWIAQRSSSALFASGADVVLPPSRVAQPAAFQGVSRNADEDGSAQALVDPTIDLLLLYTPELQALFGAEGVIEHLVFSNELLNDTLVASEVPNTVNLIGIESSAIPNSQSTLNALLALQADPTTKAQRNAYGADLVVLIRRKTLTNGNAGQAFLFLPGTTADQFAFGVSHLGCETTPTQSSCGSDDTFLHEIGHMLGGGHELGSPAGSNGWQSYSHAFSGCGPGMLGHPQISVVGSSGFPVRLYSNPAVLNQGVVCGDPVNADNARTARESLPLVGVFRTRSMTAAPAVSLVVNPDPVQPGSPAQLTWFATNSESCAASGDWTGPRAISGIEMVTPAAPGTFSFTLTCTGAGGSGSDTKTLTAEFLPPSVTMNLNPPTITRGASSSITWAATGAGSCAASGSWTGAKAASGTELVSPAASGNFDYTLTCTGQGGSTTRTQTLQVNPTIPNITFNVSPVSIVQGANATLTWSTIDATSCTASGDWSGTRTASGQETVTPNAARTFNYELSCSGPAGSSSQSRTLTVNAPAQPPPGSPPNAGGGGGGGAMSAWWLLLLGAVKLVVVRRRRRTRMPELGLLV